MSATRNRNSNGRQNFAGRARSASTVPSTLLPRRRGDRVRRERRMNPKCQTRPGFDTFSAKSADLTGLKMRRITRAVSIDRNAFDPRQPGPSLQDIELTRIVTVPLAHNEAGRQGGAEANGRSSLKAPKSVRAAEKFSRTRLSQSFFMRDFLFSEIAAIEG
jgi:hypothetical protein